jgi:hypothetical protein
MIFEKPNRKNLKIYIIYAAQNSWKPNEKIGESYQYRNAFYVSIEKPWWEKIRKQI